MAHQEPIAKAHMRIGLFGGSFNPAHAGHLHISKTALVRLELDRVWWLLSPQNPLKDAKDYASYEDRAKSAREIIDDPKIELALFEGEHGLIYTIDTIRHLRKLYAQAKFVWVMGADSFAGLDRWKDWQKIVETIPLAVFNRPDFKTSALNSKAARYYGDARLAESQSGVLVNRKAPVWCFIDQPLDYTASTNIRAQK